MKLTAKQYTAFATVAAISIPAAIVLFVVFYLLKRKRTKKTTAVKTTSDKGLKIIKEFEGYRSTAYQCDAGVWTIGYGHTSGVKEGDTCTKEQADAWLAADVQTVEAAINALAISLSQNQFDALVSLGFNIGANALLNSTLIKKAKTNPDDATIADEFLRWNKVGNTVINGLTRRRKAESELYFA